MIESQDVVIHWPFIRSHLLIDKKPAAGRILEILAERQFLAGGPVTMSGSALHPFGLTRGEVGHANTILRWLMTRGVVGRYEGAGRRPALWHFSPALTRWRLPWRWSSADVERSISLCSCRGRSAAAARIPGRADKSARAAEIFYLAENVHLRLYRYSRAKTDNARATSAEVNPVTREDLSEPRDNGPAYTSSLGRDKDPYPLEGMARLKDTIKGLTGGAVYPGSSAEEDLLEALRIAGPDNTGELAELLFREAHGLKFVPPVAKRARAIAPQVAQASYERAKGQEEAARKRWAWIQELGLEDDPTLADEVRALRDRLGSLDGGA